MDNNNALPRCPFCGRELALDSTYCRHCGRSLQADTSSEIRQYTGHSGAPPDSYLVWAILVTIFCCMPFGIVAIVYAAQVGSYLASGNHSAALASSEQARKWCFISLFAGLAIPVLYLLFFGLMALPAFFMY